MIPLRRRLTGLLEVLIGLGLLVGFVPASILLELNPSPFFLLVIYGAWVAGPWVGLTGGLLASVLYVILLTAITSFPIDVLWSFLIADASHYLTPMFLMIAGYLFGELRGQWERRLLRLQDQAQISQQEATRATARLQEAESMLHELQGRVLGQTDTMKRLYGIAQSLNVLSVDKILLELMGVLEDLLQVEAASIYRVEENQLYARLAVRTGAIPADAPNSLKIEDSAIATQVVREARIVTFAVTERRPAPIYVVPVLRRQRTFALIVIYRLPLTKVTADTKQLLSVLAQWAGDSLDHATAFEHARRAEATFEGSNVLREAFFQEQCALEEERHRRYKIPFVRLELDVETKRDEEQVPELLDELLRGTIRVYDMVAWDPEERRILILLPNLEQEYAEAVTRRILQRLNGETFRVTREQRFTECPLQTT